jgi:hypothetical protein
LAAAEEMDPAVARMMVALKIKRRMTSPLTEVIAIAGGLAVRLRAD